MPRIVETIVTTIDASGVSHIAPLGLIADGNGWIVAPFQPSRTLDNLRTVPFAVASHTDDVRVFAGCITGRRDWPLIAADRVRGVRLAEALTHWELEVKSVTEDEQRPRFHCRIVHQATHAPFEGFNRAQAAVIECAVLVTRLKMLPPEKVEAELKYLDIAIAKTAGEREQVAWSWLMERIDAWRRDQAKPGN
ncbi:MAG: DUF447 family protein [Hyphomicrobiaceae bacterium]|nr:DUF447 family protein [Hyphomicrobiaceae bacterium]